MQAIPGARAITWGGWAWFLIVGMIGVDMFGSAPPSYEESEWAPG